MAGLLDKDKTIVEYPLNKEEASNFLEMTQHPGWAVFLKCMEFEGKVYDQANHSLPYGPYALEKFRFNQGLAANLPRIPFAILEAANKVLDDKNSFESLHDTLYLEDF